MTREDCYYYHEECDMGAHIPCCTRYRELGKCPCEECDKYLSKSEAHKIIKASQEDKAQQTLDNLIMLFNEMKLEHEFLDYLCMTMPPNEFDKYLKMYQRLGREKS